MKACLKCGEVKTLEDFYKKKGASDTRTSWCKMCVLVDQKRRRA